MVLPVYARHPKVLHGSACVVNPDLKAGILKQLCSLTSSPRGVNYRSSTRNVGIKPAGTYSGTKSIQICIKIGR